MPSRRSVFSSSELCNEDREERLDWNSKSGSTEYTPDHSAVEEFEFLPVAEYKTDGTFSLADVLNGTTNALPDVSEDAFQQVLDPSLWDEPKKQPSVFPSIWDSPTSDEMSSAGSPPSSSELSTPRLSSTYIAPGVHSPPRKPSSGPKRTIKKKRANQARHINIERAQEAVKAEFTEFEFDEDYRWKCTMDGCDKKISLTHGVNSAIRHLNTHRPASQKWACPECGKNASRSDALLRHLRVPDSRDCFELVCKYGPKVFGKGSRSMEEVMQAIYQERGQTHWSAESSKPSSSKE